MTTISTTELHQRLDDPHLTIVDVRPLVAYNGWHRGGVARGGHVPGAVAFPIAWIDSVDEAEIQRLLDSKGLTAGREIAVYGDGDVDAAAFVTRLGALGIDGARILDGGAPAWAADEALPLERLPNYDKLVDIAWLREVLDGGRPEAAPNGRFLLFHVNFGVPEEYAEGHIPGALFLDTNWLEDPADWNRRPPEVIDAALRGLGITHDTTVVVYGRDTEGEANEKWPGRRAGQIAATRALMILRYAGVDDVRLLDGGYDWWVRAGNPLETELRTPTPVPSFGVKVPLRPEVIVDIDEAKEIIADPAGAPSSASGRGASTSVTSAATTTSARRAGSKAMSGATAGPTRTTCSTTATWITRCVPTRRSRPIGTRPGSHPTNGSPSTAAPAGVPARPGSTPISRAGSGSRCTTVAGSSGARIRSTTRSRSGCRSWPPRATRPDQRVRRAVVAIRAIGR